VNKKEPSIALCLHAGFRMEQERRQIAVTLRETGFPVREIADGPWDPEQDHVLLVLGNLNWFPKLRRQLLQKGRPPGSLVAIWHYEPLPPPKASGLRWPLPTLRETAKILLRDRRASDVYTNYFLLRRLARRRLPDVLAVSTRGRVEFLAERSIEAYHVPMGYDPGYGHELGLPRDLDALFLGECRIPRRRRILAGLRKQGVNLTACGDWFDPALWGDRRTELLNRSKVFLNIQRFRFEFPGLRFVLGMANGALVVSEPIYDAYPFVAGQHFVSASLEEMPAVIRHYLENEDERRRIVTEAYTFVTRQLTMKRSVSTLADLIARRAQA